MGRTLHEATIKSPPNGTLTTIFDESTPEGRFKALSNRKTLIESELAQHYDVLSANSIGLTSPLIDKEGFPRDDVPDLASVIVARARIRELKNDLRTVVDQLAQTLPLLFPKDSEHSASPSSTICPGSQSSSNSFKPFARVDLVSPASPAELAGLKLDDRIVRFGTLTAQNHDALQAIGRLVAQSEGKSVTVVWFRFEGEKKTMISKELKPCSGWGGRGLLGCHIVPIWFKPFKRRDHFFLGSDEHYPQSRL